MSGLKPQKLILLWCLTFLLTILFYHASFLFLIIDLHFLIAAVAQIINTAELVTPIGIPLKRQKQKLKYIQYPQKLK